MGVIPHNIPSLLSTLLSFSALREWFKLFIIGGAIETCRRYYSNLWNWVVERFWLQVTFDEDDCSYEWMMFWLSRQPAWKQTRSLEISTRDYGLTSPAVCIDGEDEERSTSREMTYLPSLSTSYSMWYKGHYVIITRTSVNNGIYRTKENLHLSILARDNSVLTEMLMEAKNLYKAAEEMTVAVYASNVSNNWRRITSRPKRPLNSIILDPGIKELLLNDARDFLDSREWYADRGIPFRRGYLLYGAPGSGKTSMIQSIAGELGLDVYILTLSRPGMDDNTLCELISELPRRCIALMEDIDAAFRRGISMRNLQENEYEPEPEEARQEKGKAEDASRVTLSGLLNALDGIGAQEGRILFATTNDYAALDPALCRPGRMDIHVEFKLASKFQVEGLYKCFYMPSKNEEVVDDEKSDDSGYASRDPSPERALSEAAPDTIDGSTGATISTSGAFVSVRSSPRGITLSGKKICELAAQFAAAIPEREISMASLQGYLMMYKVRPLDAIVDAPEWVERERAEKAARRRKAGTKPSP
ncbi:nucleoside triphosphate hydrolase protein [Wolfiporia cocos MD-104 SS10]|uniref:Nucleoside triphosphate hydrolase protein n=1 Tax=Wolfiporia cocos (strain MD-104) TaxID=742152 RepID=A0A2H3JI02_WOLCO|nr:nucleoside triphosphate hydrolase protein [Wolfiporia cocos MD-104 SS10]